MQITSQESQFGNVDDDVYIMKCIQYQTRKGQYGDMLNWVFEVADPNNPGKTIKLSGTTPTYLAPNSKLAKWLRGFGFTEQQLAVGSSIDLDNCLNVTVKGIVENNPDKNDPSKIYSNVTELIAKKAAQPVQQQAPQPVQQQGATPQTDWDDYA